MTDIDRKNKYKRLSVEITKEFDKEIETAAKKYQISKSDLVRFILREHLKQM